MLIVDMIAMRVDGVKSYDDNDGKVKVLAKDFEVMEDWPKICRRK